MIVPNKFVTYAESALGKVDKLYSSFDKVTSVSELYSVVKDDFDSLDQFLYAVDILYLTDKFDVDIESGVIRKC